MGQAAPDELTQALLAGLASGDDDADDARRADQMSKLDPEDYFDLGEDDNEPGDDEDADWETA